jgi:hypothetical protein
MIKHKPFRNIIDESLLDTYQSLMYELDSSLSRMRYISSLDLSDAYEIEQFNNFWRNTKDNNTVVVSISDNSDLYELDDSTIVILVENIDDKMIIFDIQDAKKIIGNIMTK